MTYLAPIFLNTEVAPYESYTEPFQKMNCVEALRNCKIVVRPGPLPADDPRKGCESKGYLENRLINLWVYETVPKSLIRKYYREYHIDNLHYFGDLILIDHQTRPDTEVFYRRRIYSFFNDSVRTNNIKLLNFCIDGTAYDIATEKGERDAFAYTAEHVYLAMVRYINRNKLLWTLIPEVNITRKKYLEKYNNWVIYVKISILEPCMSLYPEWKINTILFL